MFESPIILKFPQCRIDATPDEGRATGGKRRRKAARRGPDDLATAAVGLIMDFQRTGRGFEIVWPRIQPTLERMVRQRLRSRLVWGRFGGDDDQAVDETIQQVAVKLLELPRKPKSWFDPAKGKGGLDGLRAWLFGFCRRNVAEYCERWHGARPGRKVLVESALSLNSLTEFESVLKSAPAKVEVDRSELEEVINGCIEGLGDRRLSDAIRLHFWEGLSVRMLARRWGSTDSTAFRRLAKAKRLLKTALTDRGVDAGWLCAPA